MPGPLHCTPSLQQSLLGPWVRGQYPLTQAAPQHKPPAAPDTRRLRLNKGGQLSSPPRFHSLVLSLTVEGKEASASDNLAL